VENSPRKTEKMGAHIQTIEKIKNISREVAANVPRAY
jgi:hypothetical protein